MWEWSLSSSFLALCHAQVWQFCRLVADPAAHPMFVHCKAGVGRTGSLVACWRIVHGVETEAAIAAEGFHSAHGSLEQADFVRQFAARNAPRLARGARPAPARGAETVAAPKKVR